MFGVSRGAFPSATTQPFGSTGSTFGAQQQQQQPVANTSAFGLSQQTNTTQAPAFGNFGNQTSNSPFGMSGSTTANGTPFGQSQLTNNNASGSIFGGMGNNTALSAGSASVVPNSTAGTSIKPFTTFEEKDPTTGVINVFQSITCMPEYRNFSFEELRFQDYQAGRKFGTSQNGTGTTFNNPQGTTNTGFGIMGNNNSTTSATTGGLFGQKPATGMFGTGTGSGGGFGSGATNSTGLFGSSTNLSGNSAFGANKPATSGGLFGNTTNNPTNGTNNTGLFGQQNSNTNGGLFGQQQNSFGANNVSNGGAFGQVNRGAFPQQQTQQGSGGIFGQSNANANGGAFGQQQGTGALFGAKPASGGLFGQSAGSKAFGMNTNPTGTTGGLLGKPISSKVEEGYLASNKIPTLEDCSVRITKARTNPDYLDNKTPQTHLASHSNKADYLEANLQVDYLDNSREHPLLRLVMPKIILYLGKITNNSNQPGDYSDNKTTSRSPNLVDCLARPIKIIISHLAKMGYNNHNRIIVFLERNQLVLEIQAYSLTAQQIKVTV